MKKLLFFYLAFLTFYAQGQNNVYYNTGNERSWPYGYLDYSWTVSDEAEQAYARKIYESPVDGRKMPYRLMSPRNNNLGQKYPLYIMLHGGGEGGSDNAIHLVWGGKMAIDSLSVHPSFVFYPQTNGADWPNVDNNYAYPEQMSQSIRVLFEIIENVLLTNYNIDQDRIYLGGLSNGAKGGWEVLERRPDLFASASFFSGMGNTRLSKTLINNPIWNFQGGQDNNPNSSETTTMYDSLVANGGNPKRSEYVDRDHWSWVDAYQSKNWLPWVYAQSKKNIHILYGEQPFLCPGGRLGLGISYGFKQYIWKKDGAAIPGANAYVYYATQPGSYTVSYQRKDNSWGETYPTVVGLRNTISAKPTLTLNSSPALEFDWQTVTLTGPSGKFNYYWSNKAPVDSRSTQVGTPGKYTLSVNDNSTSCPSPESDPVIVTRGADPNLPAPTNINAIPSKLSAQISWTDNASTETGYEISYTSVAVGWANIYVGNIPANSTSAVITNLVASTDYYFKVRAISNLGFSPYSPDKNFKTTNSGNTVPTANAGSDKTLTLPQNSISFTGSGSDVDGTITGYAWTKTSGPAATLSGTSTTNLAVSNLTAGNYVFRLTVTDNNGGTGFDEVSLVVSGSNKAPVVNAGIDKTATLPVNSATFNGSATDTDGTIASYLWSQLSGPASTLSGANSSTLSVSGLTAGSYVYRLTATDNNGATGTDDVSLTVFAANQLPVANAGQDKTIILPTNTASITGSGTDADGTITAYSWLKVSGPNVTVTGSNSPTLSLSSLLQGTYIFRLSVTDNNGATATDDVSITVQGANVAPVANAGADKLLVLPSSSTTFSGSGTDADGSIASYAWIKLSGPTAIMGGAATATLTASGLVAGTYTFRLTVTDNAGATAFDDVVLTVNATNQPPVANAGSDQIIKLPGSATFTGTGKDNDGTIKVYSWTKIAGPAGAVLSGNTTPTLVVSGLVSGNYTFRLTVGDDKGATAFDDVVLTVTAAANSIPVANAGLDKIITLPASSAIFTGSGTDSDGSIVSYSWTKQSGPAATLSGAATSTLTATNLVVGTYAFRLTVKDNIGATAFDDVLLTVNASGNMAPIANAGPNQVITLPTSSATFTGTGNDSDGYITSFVWARISGPPATLQNGWGKTPTLTNLSAGTYVLRLTVTDNLGATGVSDVSLVVNPPASASITQIKLANADAQVEVGTLVNGSTINLATQPYTMTFVAYTAPSVIGSVKWLWDGNETKTVQIQPYSFTDNCWPGFMCFNAWWRPSAGTHTLTAIPYTGPEGTGTAGTPYTITLNVINSAARVSSAEENNSNVSILNVSTSPNPFRDLVRVNFGSYEEEVTIMVMDGLGKTVLVQKAFNSYEALVDLSSYNLSSGMYFMNISTNSAKAQMVKINKE